MKPNKLSVFKKLYKIWVQCYITESLPVTPENGLVTKEYYKLVVKWVIRTNTAATASP